MDGEVRCEGCGRTVPKGKYCHFCGKKLSPADDHDLYSEFDRKAKAAPGPRPVRRRRGRDRQEHNYKLALLVISIIIVLIIVMTYTPDLTSDGGADPDDFTVTVEVVNHGSEGINMSVGILSEQGSHHEIFFVPAGSSETSFTFAFDTSNGDGSYWTVVTCTNTDADETVRYNFDAADGTDYQLMLTLPEGSWAFVSV